MARGRVEGMDVVKVLPKGKAKENLDEAAELAVRLKKDLRRAGFQRVSIDGPRPAEGGYVIYVSAHGQETLENRIERMKAQIGMKYKVVKGRLREEHMEVLKDEREELEGQVGDLEARLVHRCASEGIRRKYLDELATQAMLVHPNYDPQLILEAANRPKHTYEEVARILDISPRSVSLYISKGYIEDGEGTVPAENILNLMRETPREDGRWQHNKRERGVTLYEALLDYAEE